MFRPIFEDFFKNKFPKKVSAPDITIVFNKHTDVWSFYSIFKQASDPKSDQKAF